MENRMTFPQAGGLWVYGDLRQDLCEIAAGLCDIAIARMIAASGGTGVDQRGASSDGLRSDGVVCMEDRTRSGGSIATKPVAGKR